MNRLLRTAITYLNNNDKLIYSYRGNTFLQGGELYDPQHGGRGRIDCSTLVHLALLGIEYDESPYVQGEAGRFFDTVCPWYDASSMDDCKGEQAGITSTLKIGQVFEMLPDRANDIRRAYGLAKFCRETGLEISSYEDRQPGDLVFFEAPSSVYDEYIKYGAYMAISHVGIIAEDTDMMINATGRSSQEYNALHDPVKMMSISEKGIPVITARLQN